VEVFAGAELTFLKAMVAMSSSHGRVTEQSPIEEIEELVFLVIISRAGRSHSRLATSVEGELMSDQVQMQQEIERAWLDLTYDITRAPSRSCICDLRSGVRWSGYLGSAFVEPACPRRRFLFVGANHNPNGLAKTPAITDYNEKLRDWADRDRKNEGDMALLYSMRQAYKSSWRKWGGIWSIFAAIRDELRIPDDGFAFVNLARCPAPRSPTTM
jgi:hypothetical protein